MSQSRAEIILFVEASASLAAVARDALDAAERPFEMITAKDLQEAAAQIKSRSPSLVFTDLTFEDGSCSRLLPQHVGNGSFPVVIMVDRPEETPAAVDAVRNGALDYVVKSEVTADEILRTVSRSLREWELVLKQREAETTLAQKEEFNFALFQHSPLATVVVDLEGNVIKSNLARRELDDDLPELGKPLFDPAKGELEAHLAAALAECIASGEVCRLEDQIAGQRYLSFTMAPVPHGAIVITRDLTEQKQAQEESARHHEQLIQADKMVALGTLVSGVAHEVSNPNNAMILSATALKKICKDIIPILDTHQEAQGDFDVGARSYGEVREELPNLVEAIASAAKRIQTTVGDLKAYARRDADKLHDRIDINKVVNDAVSLLGGLIRKSTQRFELHRTPDLPEVSGNAQRIEQVVVNLLTNACQALPERDRRVSVSTRLETDGRHVTIEVADEGDGIAPEHLSRIMDPFFTTKHDTGGTGLGLSISKKIVDSHGGTLNYFSEPGNGTTAVFTLPVTEHHE